MAIPNILTGLFEKIVDRGGAIIEELVTDKDLSKQLQHQFQTLVISLDHEYKTKVIEVERDMHEAQQKTIQAELHQNDLYTKRTRPKIARQSWFLSIFYAVYSLVDGLILAWMEVDMVTATSLTVEFQWEVYIAIAAPALAYMGVRGFDKWKNPNG